MTTSTSAPKVEDEAALYPVPSVPRMVVSVVSLTVACVCMHFPHWNVVAMISFIAVVWFAISPAERRSALARAVPARDLMVMGATFALLAGLLVVLHNLHIKEFPGFDRFVQHPIFLTAFWLAYCSLLVWRRRHPRRIVRTKADESGNAEHGAVAR